MQDLNYESLHAEDFTVIGTTYEINIITVNKDAVEQRELRWLQERIARTRDYENCTRRSDVPRVEG